MNLPLENKVAIVTGAGGESGSAIAQALAKAGARVVVNDINPDRAERVAAAIRRAIRERVQSENLARVIGEEVQSRLPGTRVRLQCCDVWENDLSRARYIPE